MDISFYDEISIEPDRYEKVIVPVVSAFCNLSGDRYIQAIKESGIENEYCKNLPVVISANATLPNVNSDLSEISISVTIDYSINERDCCQQAQIPLSVQETEDVKTALNKYCLEQSGITLNDYLLKAKDKAKDIDDYIKTFDKKHKHQERE